MAGPLRVKCWTNEPLKRGSNGVIRSGGLQVNCLMTRLCATCRHRSCAAVKAWRTKTKGRCEKERPMCMTNEDRLCEALGLPAANEADGITYQMRNDGMEKYLHERFLQCHPVTLTVEKGKP